MSIRILAVLMEWSLFAAGKGVGFQKIANSDEGFSVFTRKLNSNEKETGSDIIREWSLFTARGLWEMGA